MHVSSVLFPLCHVDDGRPKVYEFQKLAQRRASIDFVDPLAKAEAHAAYVLPGRKLNVVC